ncbi:SGM_5486 family transporter-associated protein [Streptomyces sp. ME03-5709C]|nr:SGM_5486 family transporter-associated protein [Streptomyces sp. ME03-5709C]
MPVLEPNPPQPQKKLLIIFGCMLAVPAVVAVIAVIAARMG